MKAETPSCRSSVDATTPKPSRSRANAASRLISEPLLISALATLSATGAFCASSVANCLTVSLNLSAGAVMFTMPSCSAVFASISFPV